MKALVRLPSRIVYVLPRVFLLGLFLMYVSFMLFSPYDWFGQVALVCRTVVFRFFAIMANLFG